MYTVHCTVSLYISYIEGYTIQYTLSNIQCTLTILHKSYPKSITWTSRVYEILFSIKEVPHYTYFWQLSGHIVTLKRFSIKLTILLVGNSLTFRQLARNIITL